MDTVTISPKYQIVIPKAIRKGSTCVLVRRSRRCQYGDRVELVPLKSARRCVAFFAASTPTVPRETDRPVNVVDSCGWLEYFAAGPMPTSSRPIEARRPGGAHDQPLRGLQAVAQQRGESDALQAVALMQQAPSSI